MFLEFDFGRRWYAEVGTLPIFAVLGREARRGGPLAYFVNRRLFSGQGRHLSEQSLIYASSKYLDFWYPAIGLDSHQGTRI
jgi:hypothetical protein